VVSEVADTEIVAGMCDTLDALKVGPYRVRFSSRKVLNLLMPFAGISPDHAADVFRVLDKLEKIGIEKIRLELTAGYRDESGDTIPGLGLTLEQVAKIEQFLSIRAARRQDAIDALNALFHGVPGAGGAIGELSRISNHLYALGYLEDRAVIDLSVARGLAYYTGPSSRRSCSMLRNSARSSAAAAMTIWWSVFLERTCPRPALRSEWIACSRPSSSSNEPARGLPPLKSW
jgi:histidyl-tRNA synthetase